MYLSQRTIDNPVRAGVAQSATPIFVAGMEELARRPDTNEANCWHAAG
jgi:hypothetical protein